MEVTFRIPRQNATKAAGCMLAAAAEFISGGDMKVQALSSMQGWARNGQADRIFDPGTAEKFLGFSGELEKARLAFAAWAKQELGDVFLVKEHDTSFPIDNGVGVTGDAIVLWVMNSLVEIAFAGDHIKVSISGHRHSLAVNMTGRAAEFLFRSFEREADGAKVESQARWAAENAIAIGSMGIFPVLQATVAVDFQQSALYRRLQEVGKESPEVGKSLAALVASLG